jgi:hypothetical protein
MATLTVWFTCIECQLRIRLAHAANLDGSTLIVDRRAVEMHTCLRDT